LKGCQDGCTALTVGSIEFSDWAIHSYKHRCTTGLLFPTSSGSHVRMEVSNVCSAKAGAISSGIVSGASLRTLHSASTSSQDIAGVEAIPSGIASGKFRHLSVVGEPVDKEQVGKTTKPANSPICVRVPLPFPVGTLVSITLPSRANNIDWRDKWRLTTIERVTDIFTTIVTPTRETFVYLTPLGLRRDVVSCFPFCIEGLLPRCG
jgi:hypothetical protein